MNLELNINEIVENILANVFNKNNLQAEIEKQVSDTISNLISYQFGYNGQMRARLQRVINDAMPTDLGGLTIHTENIKKIILGRIEALQLEEVKRIIEPELDALLKPSTKTITLSELIKLYTTYWNDLYKETRRPTVLITPPDPTSCMRFWDLALDRTHGLSKYACEFQANFCDTECLGMQIRHRNLKETLTLGHVSDPDLTLLRIGSGVTAVEYEDIDPDELLDEILAPFDEED